jgi:hypothetical protein
MATTIDFSELAQFTGSERWFKHWTGVYVTDGVHYLMENGAAWLVDAIASHQTGKLLDGDLKYFQIWTLEVRGPKSGEGIHPKLSSETRQATLTCKADSDVPPAVTQEIEFTDFPEGKIQLFLELGSIDGVNEHRVLMLTSER